MAREFRLPDIGEGLTEAEIVRWLVAEGDYVEADQPIVEVETDKAVVEIPSPYAGIVVRHGGIEGETVEVGSVLVVIGTDDDPEPPRTPNAGQPPESAVPIVGTLNEDAETLVTAPAEAGSSTSTVKALPVVRKLARDAGVDLEALVGSGPGGRITREDVEAAVAARKAPVTPSSIGEDDTSTEMTRAVSPRPSPAEATPASGVDERRPMSRLRRTIADNMSRSWSEVPHVTTFDDVDAARLLEVRQALSERHGTRIPVEALVIGAVLPALRAFPEFNATVDGDDLVVHGSHHIGIAVDTPDGLMVAVVREAASRDVLALSHEVRRLGEGARGRSLKPDELAGQTFTVSNIGAVGGGHGTPIVPPGTTAILSVGRARLKPVVLDGDLAIAPVMPLSLSYDHRVIDGAMGRRFMGLLMENLEEPALFLVG